MAELETRQNTLNDLQVTDNKWTAYKLPECKSLHQALLDTLQKRQDAWTKEEARFQFAVRANAYRLWVKDSTNTINDTFFGSDLDTVRAYKQTMDAEDEKYKADSTAKVADIETCQTRLDELSVSTSTICALLSRSIACLHNTRGY